jgi:hypothetical protein
MAPQETPSRIAPIVFEKRVASKTVTTNDINTSKEFSTNHLTMKGADRASMMKVDGSVVGLRDWGYPGYLTSSEFLIFVSIIFSIWNVSLHKSSILNMYKEIQHTYSTSLVLLYQLVCLYVHSIFNLC